MNNLEKASQSCQQIVEFAVRGVFVGEELIIQKLLAGAMANGHVLLRIPRPRENTAGQGFYSCHRL